MARTLADALNPEANSFNLVRLLAALAVIVSHGFLVPFGYGAKEPLQDLTALTLGQHAVNIFFVISGATLARSLSNNPNLTQYAVARLLRIVPALIGFGLVFAFLIGPVFTSASVSVYFSDANTWLYPMLVGLQFQHAAPPPGVFETVPIPGAVNNPLWTIKYEVFAYLALGMVAFIGALNRRWIITSALVLFVVLTQLLQPSEESSSLGPLFQAAKFGTCFLLGVTAYLMRSHIPISAGWLVASIAIAVVLSFSPFALFGYLLVDAHLTFVVGAAYFGVPTEWTRRNDISYGVYIYGWPIQQSIIALFPGIGAFAAGSLSILLAVTIGYLSWWLIESPVLSFKHRALGWLAQLRINRRVA